jgi:hypothetical protein
MVLATIPTNVNNWWQLDANAGFGSKATVPPFA